MKFINNIDLKIFYIVVLCFAVENCMAHVFTDHPATNIEPHPVFRHHPGNHHQANHHQANHHQANPHPAEPPAEFSHSQSPQEAPMTELELEPELAHGRTSFGHSSSFKAAFSDILKGSIHNPPELKSQKSEAKQSSLGIEQICMHTEYPDICLATINPLLTQNFDMINVLEAAIKACSIQIKLTIAKVAKHAARNPEVANAVFECRDQYKNAMDNLQKAMDALPVRDLGTVTVMLSTVMADVSTCESAFEDLKQSPHNEQSKSDGLVSITVSNCLSIASLIPY
ncbi:unnamed protein product [Lathyrus oleraceus]|uniref:Pectinesterase inhibitor domain-containing protein n=1 Tax=Pisum sativum TaxID=3888 RepID=A0A9D5GZE5_PEA|nr:uncharacterized protein LOC127074109 [Pisum sativum]KAI5446582.1 hypothetical protein KIW84_014427 [Pisum sativum]